MKVRRETKQELARAMQARYARAGRVERGRLLDEFVALTGYHRKYAVKLLRHGPPTAAASRQRPGRPSRYGPEVVAALKIVAEALGWICGKRLAAALQTTVPALECEGALHLSEEERATLLGMSPATIDRKLRLARFGAKPTGRTTTKPGSLLKSQIPIHTFTPWNEQRPGFIEIDLVAHCGESTAGTYLSTFTAIDIATGWTECVAIADKGQEAALAALCVVRDRLPFPLLGIDSDNGSEFLHEQLLRYGQDEQLTFTRCRAYHKNDQAHVEQKNWSVVRQLVGYERFECADELAQLERIYALVRLEVNGYLPVMKLIAKERQGAKVTKHYDIPATPYQRANAAGVLTLEAQARFAADLAHAAPGPLALRRRLDAELAELRTLHATPRPLRRVSVSPLWKVRSSHEATNTFR
jgi:hypothetical protein